MVTALSVTHGFFTTTSRTGSHRKRIKANVWRMYYGTYVIIAIPVTLIAGPIYKVAQKMVPSAYTREGDISALGAQKEFTDQEMPVFGMSLLTATLPVILMLVLTITQLVTGTTNLQTHLNLSFI